MILGSGLSNWVLDGSRRPRVVGLRSMREESVSSVFEKGFRKTELRYGAEKLKLFGFLEPNRTSFIDKKDGF